ncbi:hypothetical protein Phum_PHUM067040 [Pediculus humanus corporis]|uniref:Uncharacterized protein n=1 Tax=Pediculus humanus subsp. corporis TaxID=121224 RepID=E0VBR5_PEDHC|nr:uncharacterized protein Phum_PHUM067040 [Pediculus humanus corporis]EEB10821.1 hypothetical protein Phum_PHUM067040 [Pediculus humanus corporis]
MSATTISHIVSIGNKDILIVIVCLFARLSFFWVIVCSTAWIHFPAVERIYGACLVLSFLEEAATKKIQTTGLQRNYGSYQSIFPV